MRITDAAVQAVRRQALEEAEHAIGSTILKHQASDYEGMTSLEAYEAGQINGLECAQASLVALSAEPAQGEQWHDMKDAPKDGTKIDVWMMPHGYRETDVFWSDIQDAWCRESEYPDEPTPLSVVPYPAFWMPRPAAPEAEA